MLIVQFNKINFLNAQIFILLFSIHEMQLTFTIVLIIEKHYISKKMQ